MMTRWLAILALLSLCLGTACKEESSGDQASGEQKVPPIPPHEIERGKTACEAWAERACRCDHQTCQEAETIPRALAVAVEAANGVKETEARARLQLEARRIIARCIEQQAKIDPTTCPMKPAQ